MPILALAVASFAIGTTEFVIMGLLPNVADSFHVTIPAAGYLVTGYALGVVIGAPLVAMATNRLPRKTALLYLMAVFVIGNLGCALAPSYALLMLARVVAAFAHGAFFGIGALVVRDLMPRELRAKAVSLMFAGLTLANVLGVPAGTALGNATGWRMTFWCVVAIGMLAFIGIILFVPSGLAGSRKGLTGEFRALGRWPVLLPMVVSVIGSVSLFSVFTYITPFLEQVTGLSSRGVTAGLLIMGVGFTAGNLIGGVFADRNLVGTVVGSFVGLFVTLGILAFVCRDTGPVFAILVVWGGLAFALVTPLQTWVMEAAADAPNLASILNQGAFNLGNALGAALGGGALTAGVTYAQLPFIGAAVAAFGLLVLVFARRRAGLFLREFV